MSAGRYSIISQLSYEVQNDLLPNSPQCLTHARISSPQHLLRPRLTRCRNFWCLMTVPGINILLQALVNYSQQHREQATSNNLITRSIWMHAIPQILRRKPRIGIGDINWGFRSILRLDPIRYCCIQSFDFAIVDWQRNNAIDLEHWC